MLGSLNEERITLEEIHRFSNTPLNVGGSLCWDIVRLFEDLKAGLRKAAQIKVPLASISTDSWGVDYMLFDQNGVLLEPTFHYRDGRATQGVANTKAKLNRETIFAETGIQFMPMNTIYQLAAESPERLRHAHHLLMIGDGFNYLLTGAVRAEETLASTSQLYNPRTKGWSKRLLGALELPEHLFPPIVPAGTRLGVLKSELADETGWSSASSGGSNGLEVIASCSHDTAAAVAAVPASGDTWAYLSSGTWSLMGVELSKPVINDRCRELNFTNEIGFGGSIRLLKNIIGLWIVQECRRDWTKAGYDLDYAALTEMAEKAPPFISLINPDDARFIGPGEMPSKVAAFCEQSGQVKPANPGATIRCVLESLALLYCRTLRRIEELIGKRIERLHIVGGGSRNRLLNQFTANALQIPVIAGPVEATALGNIAVQALTLGHLDSLVAARELVRSSSELSSFQPQEPQVWREALERFARLVNG